MAKGDRVQEAPAPQEYECLVPIDHTGDRCIYPAGTIIRLDHLAPAMIDRLVTRGFVRPVVSQEEGPVS